MDGMVQRISINVLLSLFSLQKETFVSGVMYKQQTI